ncbi:MAG: putative exonuclease/polymerase [Candidatus Tokpelaia sp. JSC085]|nr:MAG: putative exonuclease/polymerase [Candidatus Tokpelaia sp. JSC085]
MLAFLQSWQVHDELVFELPKEEIEETIPVVRKIMAEAATPAVQFAVPLKVSCKKLV